jgi:hypothetical protein
MPETSWPFDNADTTQAQFLKWASVFAEDGFVSGLGLSAASGMNVSLAAGTAIIRGFFYENTAALQLAIPAAHASMARKDRVVLRLDLDARTIVAAVKVGTPTAGGGTLASLTRTATVWEHELHQVTVPAGAANIVAGNLAQRLQGTGLRLIPYISEAMRPAPATSPAMGVNVSTRRVELFVDGAWYPIIPEAVTWGNLPGKPAWFVPAQHEHPFTEVLMPNNQNVGDWANSNFARVQHQHTWGGIIERPSSYPPSSHEHDAQQIKVAGEKITDWVNNTYSKLGHAHSWASITGRPGTFTPSGHDHDVSDVRIGGQAIHEWVSSNFVSNSTRNTDINNLNASIGKKQDALGYRPVRISSNHLINIGYQGTQVIVGVDAATIGAIQWQGVSSRRYKKLIRDWEATDEKLDAFLALPDVTYQLKVDAPGKIIHGDDRIIGWIAEDLHAAGFPELVPVDENGEPDRIDYQLAVVPLHALAKRQQLQLNEQAALITELANRIAKLEGETE